jgi:transcription elongation GreA/GreB family factor
VQADTWADGESLRVEAGDRVVLAYHDEPNRQRTIRLTANEREDDPDMGIIFVGRPIAKALLEHEEEDVIDVVVGRGVRQATILRIERPPANQ